MDKYKHSTLEKLKLTRQNYVKNSEKLIHAKVGANYKCQQNCLSKITQKKNNTFLKQFINQVSKMNRVVYVYKISFNALNLNNKQKIIKKQNLMKAKYSIIVNMNINESVLCS